MVTESGLESREYGRGQPLHWPRDTLYPQKLALTSPTSGVCSVGMIRSRTKTTDLVNGNRVIQLRLWKTDTEFIAEQKKYAKNKCFLLNK
jgi:hypothetical protein